MITERQILGSVLGVLVALAVASLLAAAIAVDRIEDRLVSTEDLHAAAVKTAATMNTNVNASAQEALAYIISGVVDEKADALAAFDKFDGLVASFKAADAHDDEVAAEALVESIVRAQGSYRTVTGELFADFEDDGSIDLGRFDRYEASLDEVTTHLASLIALEEAEALEAQIQAVETERRARDVVLQLGLIVAALSLAAAVFTLFLYRRLSSARRAAEIDLGLQTQALEAASVGVVVASAIRPDAPLIYANPAFERITGYSQSEILGTNCRFLQGARTDPVVVTAMRDAIAAGEPSSVIVENYRANGTSFWNDLHIAPVRDEKGHLTHFVGVTNDVSERIRLESRVRQARKMDAVGQLAGGIAHDFNNYLMVIDAAISVMEREDEPDIDFWLKRIAEAGSKSAALTRQLMTFARAQIVRVEVVNLDDIIASLEPLLAGTIDENVSTTIAVEGTEPSLVLGDRSQLEQVVTNVVLNARDAMPNGGAITIETSTKTLTSEDVAGQAEAKPGPYVMLAISDTGEGIDPAIVGNIFEPFMTTKPPGEGSGLGLATVYGIVTQAGGLISVYSEPGHGTTFKIFFPAAEGELATTEPVAQEPDVLLDTHRPVLLVEDDQIVRTAMAAMLASLGFDVLEAENGQLGLDVLGVHPEIGLIVSDVTMPGMGGIEMAERARELRPDVKVLLVSGYTRSGLSRLRTQEAVLTKPFNIRELKLKLVQLLSADTS